MTEEEKKTRNYVELTNDLILEKAKKELSKLQEEFNKIANDNAKIKKKGELYNNKLDSINKLVQESKLDNKDKDDFINALNVLKESINSKNIDNKELQNTFNEIIKLLDCLIKNELTNLEQEIKTSQTGNYKIRKPWEPIRPDNIKQEIENSSERIPELIENAKNDKSWFIRNVIANLLERAIS